MDYVENKKITNIKVKETPEQLAIRLHNKSPHVYAKFKQLTLQAIRAEQFVGAKAICEVMRWQTTVEQGGSPFKICNTCISYYARWFMRDYPQYKGYFRTRG